MCFIFPIENQNCFPFANKLAPFSSQTECCFTAIHFQVSPNIYFIENWWIFKCLLFELKFVACFCPYRILESVTISVCLFICICPSVYLYVSVYLFIYLYLLTCLIVLVSLTILFIYLSIYIFFLSVYSKCTYTSILVRLSVTQCLLCLPLIGCLTDELPPKYLDIKLTFDEI